MVEPIESKEDTFKFKLPFMSGEFQGKVVLWLILIVLVTAPSFYFFLRHDEKTTQQLGALIESQEAITYILTLTQEERNQLQLSKPKRIREMQNEAYYQYKELHHK